MKIRDVQFIGSFPKFSKIPIFDKPEFCFWGRSNVGKSSMINYLCDRKDLARTSSTPGKTISFNLYQINQELTFVDLPGFGFARVAKSVKEKWDGQIKHYIKERKDLVCVFLLVDISIPIQKNDLEKINFFGDEQTPFCIIFTKSDRCKKLELKKNIETWENKLLEKWEVLPPRILSSVEKRIGKEEILLELDKIVALSEQLE
jgi:GTP-binding protein